MSKPKIDRRGKKPLNAKRLVQLMRQHLTDTGMMDAFAFPLFLPEEDARAKYLADDLVAKLTAAVEPSPHPGISPVDQAARIRNKVIIQMYRMIVAGGIQFLSTPRDQVKYEAPALPEAEIEILAEKVVESEPVGIPYEEALAKLKANTKQTIKDYEVGDLDHA